MEPVVFRVTADRAIVYQYKNPSVIGCYRRAPGSGTVYDFEGCVEIFEDVGYWLNGDEMEFIQDKPDGLPKRLELRMVF